MPCSESSPSLKAPRGLLLVPVMKLAQGALLILFTKPTLLSMLHSGPGRDVLLWTVLKNSQKAISHVQERLGKYGKVPRGLLTVCTLRISLSSQLHGHPLSSSRYSLLHDTYGSIDFPLTAVAPTLATRSAEKTRNI